jgi:hypothetical protein
MLEEILSRSKTWLKSSLAEGLVVTEREGSSFAMSVARLMKIANGREAPIRLLTSTTATMGMGTVLQGGRLATLTLLWLSF